MINNFCNGGTIVPNNFNLYSNNNCKPLNQQNVYNTCPPYGINRLANIPNCLGYPSTGVGNGINFEYYQNKNRNIEHFSGGGGGGGHGGGGGGGGHGGGGGGGHGGGSWGGHGGWWNHGHGGFRRNWGGGIGYDSGYYIGPYYYSYPILNNCQDICGNIETNNLIPCELINEQGLIQQSNCFNYNNNRF